MSYDENCKKCPYNEQEHLNKTKTKTKTKRLSVPIELENNESDVLLIFQAPGIKEWEVGKAIQPTNKVGGTAGVRINNSWVRESKSRDDFDIINIVQCFPGNNGNRDLKPKVQAVRSCCNRLRVILKSNQYKKIIIFGSVAQDAFATNVSSVDKDVEIICAPHPCGGTAQSILDALW